MTTVLVHPGSLFGSADLNICRDDAQCARDTIWREDIEPAENLFVLEGIFFEECGYNFSNVPHASMPADPNTRDLRKAAQVTFLASDGPYLVTGAWLQENGQGCVDIVVKALRDEDQEAHASRHGLQIQGQKTPHELWEPADFRA